MDHKEKVITKLFAIDQIEVFLLSCHTTDGKDGLVFQNIKGEGEQLFPTHGLVEEESEVEQE